MKSKKSKPSKTLLIRIRQTWPDLPLLAATTEGFHPPLHQCRLTRSRRRQVDLRFFPPGCFALFTPGWSTARGTPPPDDVLLALGRVLERNADFLGDMGVAAELERRREDAGAETMLTWSDLPGVHGWAASSGESAKVFTLLCGDHRATGLVLQRDGVPVGRVHLPDQPSPNNLLIAMGRCLLPTG